MDKHLVHNEAEYVKLFEDFELNDAERLLGVEFAYEDGTYQRDFTFDGTNPDNEDQDVDMTKYRKGPDANFPDEYPCVVVMHVEESFDRMGDVRIEFMEFVYAKDFAA